MKAAIVILSDPKSGSEEALGRVFNALAAAYDFQQNGEEVTVLFQGVGTTRPLCAVRAGRGSAIDYPYQFVPEEVQVADHLPTVVVFKL